jgi:GTP-binding protein
MDEEGKDISPLFQAIAEKIPAPEGDDDAPLQMLANTLDYDDYVGRIVIGRIVRGVIKNGQQVSVISETEERKGKIGRLYEYQGLKRVEIPQAASGEIVALVGLADIGIGDTIADPGAPEALPGIKIDEPTLSMVFSVNNGPFAGREGTYVTSRHLRDRLFREIETNVSMKVEETDSTDSFTVAGRGELHLSILIETMRREGFELQVSKPKVIYKTINGELCEPIEKLTVDVPKEFMGTVMETLGLRRAELVNMHEIAACLRMEFLVPARGLIGFRNELLTNTKGNGTMHNVFNGYAPYKGDIPGRTRGALVAFEEGETTGYGIYGLQDRGVMFVAPGEPVYEGMVIGENSRELDMDVNPCKKKHVTNMRSSSSDEAIRLIPPRAHSLEQALEYINEDETVEVTPRTIRIRKKILSRVQRARLRGK